MAELDTAVQQNSWLAGDKRSLIVCGGLTLLGIICWMAQIALGMDALAVGDVVAWGVYIAAFFLLAGIGGGMLILTALAELGILPSLKKWSRHLLVAVIACLVAAGFMILMDLGEPKNILNILLRPNFSSMFFWDFLFLAVAVILALLGLFLKSGKILAGLSMTAGIAVILTEGLILALSAGKPLWHNPLIPITFLFEGLIAALAIILLVKLNEQKDYLVKILAACLGIVLILSLTDLVVVNYLTDSSAAQNFRLLTSGGLAPLYWIQIALCLALPLGLLLVAKSQESANLACALALLGVFLAKINLLLAGQAISSTGVVVGYTATLIEVGALLGGLGFAALLFLLGQQYLLKKADPS